jgi:phthalate 4,5-dioxygenase oxygenase subunit
MNKEQSDLLVQTGPNTPMGKLMRRFWVPVMLADEIAEPDGAPVRVKILGERLLAFRDTAGRPGLVGEACCHRGASLFFGRNEEGGIRCSFHGWKYDVTGQCIELPQVPELAEKKRITAYPCLERGGVLWAYMGPPELRPEPPGLEWAAVPAENRYVSKRLQECNYLQAMEGGIDTSHASWVHKFELDTDPMHKGAKANKYIKADGSTVFEIAETANGLTLYGRRKGEPDSNYWRITQWIFPWYSLIPPFGDHPLGGHIWVPIDDETCWAWSVNFYPDKPLSAHERESMDAGLGIHVKYIPGTFRPVANKDNDYLIDRQAQKDMTLYSGIEGFSMQDASLQESMGPIQDRTMENLIPTDRAIVMARRLLMKAALDLEAGIAPPALHSADQHVRAASVLLDRELNVQDWAKGTLDAGADKPVFTV